MLLHDATALFLQISVSPLAPNIGFRRTCGSRRAASQFTNCSERSDKKAAAFLHRIVQSNAKCRRCVSACRRQVEAQAAATCVMALISRFEAASQSRTFERSSPASHSICNQSPSSAVEIANDYKAAV
uniref:Uncharacterized protein n=1 Tax=Peronospora matthiolae TaxID=2874970 RepID=A0AAV1VIY8_9STRA